MCRSFYPLYPPADGMPLDYSLAHEALQIPSIPDILILPSDLTHFMRVKDLFFTRYLSSRCLMHECESTLVVIITFSTDLQSLMISFLILSRGC